MDIQTNKEQWNQFIVENEGCFLQSWQWGELQESMNRKIWRIETQGLKGLVIKHDINLGKNYLYCPRGPIGQGDFNNFIEQVKEIAHQEGSIFFKIELEEFKVRPQQRSDLKFFVKSSKQIQPVKTVILDISKSEKELLKQMHQKTRYNICLAQKKGIEIKESEEGLDDFIRLLKQTAKRDRFFLHPRKYYQKLLKRGLAKLFLAYYQNKVIAANLICFFGQTATYLHGASDYNHRQLMAPYLLQWQTILKAKEKGLTHYDFWGINEEKWPGVTRFKKGFGGQEVSYPGSFDLIFQKTWYKVYNLARKIL
ncbi:aminoacyltransferase [Patescibacteria group bacterium]|nr:aminoacyltransferase [Patescibacteria group bacterium]MBU1563575.1 aminoacyltransferase [Patescibacteria group bacterium]MBU2068269.1 aminoacyltransferase [Patescibacteria group bacterium]